MSQFADLTEILDPFLPLPIAGKIYRVPAVDAATGLRAQATVQLAAKVKAGDEISAVDIATLQLDDEEEVDFTESMLGSTYGEMIADGVNWPYIRHAAATAFAWTVMDRDSAAKVWAEGGGSPEGRRPAPQDRKAPAKKATKKSARPASAAGQKHRPTAGSPGATSSATGA